MTKSLLSLLLLAAVAGSVSADGDRERRVRVALALSGSRPAASSVAVAPPPRAVVPKPALAYADGYRLAAADQLPLVVFVGCEGRLTQADAVTTRVDTFGTVKSPAVVVGFPRGDRLFIDTVLNCPVREAELTAAVKTAAKKIDQNPAKMSPPAPPPLDWQLHNDHCQLRNGVRL
jgi:hypothetical protein